MVKSLKSNKGFTLVELIIVIAILAIIMLIAIPNFSGIQQRMQVRADKATAAQIGKAVRVWFMDYTTDKTLTAIAEGQVLPVAATVNIGGTDKNIKGLPTQNELTDPKVVKYDTLAGIEGYISKGQTPVSLKTGANGNKVKYQHYCVTLSEDATSAGAKILVSICAEGEDAGGDPDGNLTEPTFGTPITANYDGSTSAVAYVEP
ncbi:MAG: prepilin-type N-terminal cleavage/methylation domain-containing protein [Clostridia bacterium]|nr:prepilin-type N-terminal cleavage/methylation domain-containing protein [Clostridia bacterium]